MTDLNSINVFYFVTSLFVIISFFIFFEIIANFVNIFDKPEKIRKIHSKKTPPIGGFIFYIIFLSYSLCVLIFDFQSQLFTNNKQIISFIICSSLIFFTGIIDDKYNLNSLKKIVYFVIIILIYLLNDLQAQIFYLRFETFNTTLALDNFSLFFSIFCIFVFINAINMFDGINLQSGLYLLLISVVFLMKNIDPMFFVLNIIALIFFLYFNYKTKVFLGNNGIYFLAFLFSIFFIKSNNYIGKITIEEISILMMIPGLDMLRLFFNRIFNGKSPFLADKNHIHHILLNNYNNTKVALIIFSLTLVPYFFYTIYDYAIFILTLQFISYFLIIKSSNKIKSI